MFSDGWLFIAGGILIGVVLGSVGTIFRLDKAHATELDQAFHRGYTTRMMEDTLLIEKTIHEMGHEEE